MVQFYDLTQGATDRTLELIERLGDRVEAVKVEVRVGRMEAVETIYLRPAQVRSNDAD